MDPEEMLASMKTTFIPEVPLKKLQQMKSLRLLQMDLILLTVIVLYWKGDNCYFFRSTVIEKLKTFKGDSQVMDRMMNVENKFPFMS